jgi:hypothetical protein
MVHFGLGFIVEESWLDLTWLKSCFVHNPNKARESALRLFLGNLRTRNDIRREGRNWSLGQYVEFRFGSFETWVMKNYGIKVVKVVVVVGIRTTSWVVVL